MQAGYAQYALVIAASGAAVVLATPGITGCYRRSAKNSLMIPAHSPARTPPVTAI